MIPAFFIDGNEGMVWKEAFFLFSWQWGLLFCLLYDSVLQRILLASVLLWDWRLNLIIKIQCTSKKNMAILVNYTTGLFGRTLENSSRSCPNPNHSDSYLDILPTLFRNQKEWYRRIIRPG